ncbi:MAG TPA: hypothetical protein VIF57_29815 [Polyangia bacterium]|jgi:hypothetical protein
MKKTTKNTGIKVTSNVKGGGVPIYNHNRNGLKVQTGVRAALSFVRNHNVRGL